MRKRHNIQLTEEQCSELEKLIQSGRAPARVQTRARILLLAAQGKSDDEIGASLLTTVSTIQRTLRRFTYGGTVDGAQKAGAVGLDGLEMLDIHLQIQDKPRPGRPPHITGDVEAKLTMLACSTPPRGRARWTLQLLADRMVELGYVDSISDTWVDHKLKKMRLSRG